MKTSGDLPTELPHILYPEDVGLTVLMEPSDAPILATHVMESLACDAGSIVLDLRSVSVITTAFANQLFSCLFALTTPSILKSRLTFRTSNATQREVLRRSIQAVINNI
jgi:hypothetical protein